MPRITLAESTPLKPAPSGRNTIMPRITLSGSTPAKTHPIQEEQNQCPA